MNSQDPSDPLYRGSASFVFGIYVHSKLCQSGLHISQMRGNILHLVPIRRPTVDISCCLSEGGAFLTE